MLPGVASDAAWIISRDGADLVLPLGDLDLDLAELVRRTLRARGVREQVLGSQLAIDLEALAGGTLVTTAIAGRFPDGLLFDAPMAGATPPPKSLDRNDFHAALDMGNLSLEDAAAALGISASTADRYWAYARAWLFEALRRDGSATTG